MRFVLAFGYATVSRLILALTPTKTQQLAAPILGPECTLKTSRGQCSKKILSAPSHVVVSAESKWNMPAYDKATIPGHTMPTDSAMNTKSNPEIKPTAAPSVSAVSNASQDATSVSRMAAMEHL